MNCQFPLYATCMCISIAIANKIKSFQRSVHRTLLYSRSEHIPIEFLCPISHPPGTCNLYNDRNLENLLLDHIFTFQIHCSSFSSLFSEVSTSTYNTNFYTELFQSLAETCSTDITASLFSYSQVSQQSMSPGRAMSIEHEQFY